MYSFIFQATLVGWSSIIIRLTFFWALYICVRASASVGFSCNLRIAVRRWLTIDPISILYWQRIRVKQDYFDNKPYDCFYSKQFITHHLYTGGLNSMHHIFLSHFNYSKKNYKTIRLKHLSDHFLQKFNF